jgi:predicted Zn-dependent peptidase
MKYLIVQWISLNTVIGVFVQTIVAGGVGMLVYVGVGILLRNEDVRGFASALRRKMFAHVKTSETIGQEA